MTQTSLKTLLGLRMIAFQVQLARETSLAPLKELINPMVYDNSKWLTIQIL